MSSDLRTATESKSRTALTVVGALHLVVAATLSWALTVKLTPPNKPVENGLEVLFPGAVIILLGIPLALTGVALVRQGINAAKLAVNVDVTAMILVACAVLLIPNIWIALAALPFAADVAVLLILVRKPS